MSRIGNAPITVPNGVTLTQKEGAVHVVGPKGTIKINVPEGLSFSLKDGTAEIKMATPNNSHIHGLLRALIQNAVTGVTKGWEKTLELVGVGYRAAGGGTEVTMQVGFSHPVKVTAPKDIAFKVVENTKIVISGIDKKEVGEVAAGIRGVKPPEPYKGKGIRYLGEVVRKKAGKVVKAAGAAA